MAFGDDVRGELFNKLGVESKNDPLTLLDQGDKEIAAGNQAKGKTIYQQALEIAKAQADKFIAQSEHRSAAQALYVQALAQSKLGDDVARNELYTRVTDELIEASKTAIAFEENKRGIATVTLAGLVCLMHNNIDRAFAIYTEYIDVASEKPDSEFLKKLLYSLGYLLDAIRNDNIGALADAQNFISTDLRPLLGTAKLTGFEVLLNTVVKYTQETLQSRITMPKLTFASTVPRDLLFNQVFDLKIDLENTGDGTASDLEIKITIPDEIEILDGKIEERIGTFDPSQTLNRTLSLRFQTGDPLEQKSLEISGVITYSDMLGNSHEQYFGPLVLEFAAVSKKEDFGKQLENFEKELAEMTQTHGIIPLEFITSFKKLTGKYGETIRNAIGEEQFDKVEFGIGFVEEATNYIKQFTQENEISRNVNQKLVELIDVAKSTLRTELTTTFNEEKSKEIIELTTKNEEETRGQLQTLREKLMIEHKHEVEKMKEEHDNELRQIQTSSDNKLRQQLAQLENSLKDDFRSDMDKKNEETETAIRELQENERVAVEDAVKQTREELTTKYEAKIKELDESLEEMKRQLTTRAQEEKELELTSLRQRLEQDMSEALEKQEREITERITREFDTKIHEKDNEIRDLKAKLTTSNDGPDN